VKNRSCKGRSTIRVISYRSRVRGRIAKKKLTLLARPSCWRRRRWRRQRARPASGWRAPCRDFGNVREARWSSTRISSRASCPSASSRLPPTPPAISRFVRQCPSIRTACVLGAYYSGVVILIGVCLECSYLAQRPDRIAGTMSFSD